MKRLIIMLLFIPYWVNGQLVISSSGDYTLGTNVSGSTGILINASNVTLDLAGLTVSSSATGITIAAGLSNIIIKNGIITTSVTGIVINQNCFNIQLQDLVIQNCTTRAVQIVGSLGNLIQRISLSNILFDFHTSCQILLVFFKKPVTIPDWQKFPAYDLKISLPVSSVLRP